MFQVGRNRGILGWLYDIIITYVPLGRYQGLKEGTGKIHQRNQSLATDEPLILSTDIIGAWWVLGILSRSSCPQGAHILEETEIELGICYSGH